MFSRRPSIEIILSKVGCSVYSYTNLRNDKINVAAVITRGARERYGIKDWWFGESQTLLSIVHGNSILEIIDLRYHKSGFGLWRTANELIKVVDIYFKI